MTAPTITNRNQHYVPAVYLQNFSENRTLRNREALVWCFDGTAAPSRKKVKRICRQEWTYSERAPEQEKDYFSRSEEAWGEAARELTTGDSSFNPLLITPLIFNLLVLHFRNVAYRNISGGERLDVMNGACIAAALSDFVGIRAADADARLPGNWAELIVGAMQKHWCLSIVGADRFQLWTSDNPVLRLAPESRPDCIFYGAPVDPRRWIFAFDRRKMHIEGAVADDRETHLLNFLIAAHSNETIFTSLKPSEAELDHARRGFASRHEGGAIAKDYAELRAVSPPPVPWIQFEPRTREV